MGAHPSLPRADYQPKDPGVTAAYARPSLPCWTLRAGNTVGLYSVTTGAAWTNMHAQVIALPPDERLWHAQNLPSSHLAFHGARLILPCKRQMRWRTLSITNGCGSPCKDLKW